MQEKGQPLTLLLRLMSRDKTVKVSHEFGKEATIFHPFLWYS